MPQFGLKEVMDFTITNYHPDLFKRKPIISVDYAQVTTIENSGERIDIEGGKGYQKLLALDHSKSTSLSLTIPLIDLKTLALISGDEVLENVKKTYKREIITVEEVTITDDTDPSNPVTVTQNQAKLKKKPLAGSLYVYKLGGYRDLEEQLTPAEVSGAIAEGEYQLDNVSGDIIILNANEYPAGKQLVVYYHFETMKPVKNLIIDPTKFTQAISFYGDTFMRDQFDELDKVFHMVGHKGRIQPNYTLSMTGTDTAVLELTIDLYAVMDKTNGKHIYLEYIEDEDNEYLEQEGTHI